MEARMGYNGPYKAAKWMGVKGVSPGMGPYGFGSIGGQGTGVGGFGTPYSSQYYY